MHPRWLVPPQPFLRALLQRAVVLWILGRLMILCFVLFYEGAEHVATEAVCLGPPASLTMAALVGGLTLLDVHRRHEVILLGNLGVSRTGVVLLAALPSLALEALTCLIPA